jgi:hypothetical protein
MKINLDFPYFKMIDEYKFENGFDANYKFTK